MSILGGKQMNENKLLKNIIDNYIDGAEKGEERHEALMYLYGLLKSSEENINSNFIPDTYEKVKADKDN